MVLEYVIVIGLAFTLYLAFFLPVITYEQGFSYWKARDIYHILVFTTFGFAILFLRSLQNIVIFVLTGLALLAIHYLITQQNVVKKLYDFMRRDGVTHSERSLYTLATNIMLTILAIIHWNRPVYFTIALIVMGWADKMGEIIGRVEGEHEFDIVSTKTVEGSTAVFITSIVILLGSTAILGMLNFEVLPLYIILGVIITVSEAISIKFLDNVLIPYITSFGLVLISTV